MSVKGNGKGNGRGAEAKEQKRRAKELHAKEGGWVLDCVNEVKAKLKPYNAASDKYFKHFVVRVPRRKKGTAKSTVEPIDSSRFRAFLSQQKSIVLSSRFEAERRREALSGGKPNAEGAQIEPSVRQTVH
jgi:hypothetical protein